MTTLRILAAGLTIACAGLPLAGQLAAQDSAARKGFVLPHVLEVIGHAIEQPMPAGLSPGDQKSYAAETEWLKSVRTRLEETGRRVGILAPRDAATGMATGRRQYQPLEIQKEIDALRQALEREGRQFNTLSNASKARHDIAMNAIRNLKG
ncbi:MAG TPA: hypothetical protein VGQ73_09935 [Gemmatimonadales bacterium]|jgi:hypothetical protein|nr:hypothetical protein [Gemmatimonadales bacterium]